MADASGLALLYEEIQHAVVDVSFTEVLHAAAYGVQQVVVDVVRLQVDERLAVHFHGELPGWIGEIGQFCGNEVFVPWVPFEGCSGGVLGESAQICRSGVEIVDAML